MYFNFLTSGSISSWKVVEKLFTNSLVFFSLVLYLLGVIVVVACMLLWLRELFWLLRVIYSGSTHGYVKSESNLVENFKNGIRTCYIALHYLSIKYFLWIYFQWMFLSLSYPFLVRLLFLHIKEIPLPPLVVFLIFRVEIVSSSSSKQAQTSLFWFSLI